MQAKDPAEVKLLDMATRTGHLASFVMDNFPTLDAAVIDLSPFYFSQAVEEMMYNLRS